MNVVTRIAYPFFSIMLIQSDVGSRFHNVDNGRVVTFEYLHVETQTCIRILRDLRTHLKCFVWERSEGKTLELGSSSTARSCGASTRSVRRVWRSKLFIGKIHVGLVASEITAHVSTEALLLEPFWSFLNVLSLRQRAFEESLTVIQSPLAHPSPGVETYVLCPNDANGYID